MDYANDGDEDVWIGYHDQGGKPWRSNGAHTNTRAAAGAWPRINGAGKNPDRHSCAGGGGRNVALGDADDDGDLDVYGLVSNVAQNTNPGDMLPLNNHLTFTKLTAPTAGGVGASVITLDRAANGQDEFLVSTASRPLVRSNCSA